MGLDIAEWFEPGPPTPLEVLQQKVKELEGRLAERVNTITDLNRQVDLLQQQLSVVRRAIYGKREMNGLWGPILSFDVRLPFVIVDGDLQACFLAAVDKAVTRAKP